MFLRFFCAAISATGATIIARIDAEKDMVLIKRRVAHGNQV
jgi:hypothetical protein